MHVCGHYGEGLSPFRDGNVVVIWQPGEYHKRRMVVSVQNHERRGRLLDLIRVRGFAALEELVRELGVSESTVRRDLDALEEQGAAKRTHGGVLYAGGMPRLAEFDERQPANWRPSGPSPPGQRR